MPKQKQTVRKPGYDTSTPISRSLALTAAALGLLAMRTAGTAVLGRKLSFRNKNVVITGGSRGLGLVLARRFASEGANIALLARDERELAAAAADLSRGGTRVVTIPCDLRGSDEARAAVRRAAAALGGIDVLVNNAGTIIVGPFEDISLQDFHDAVDLHLWAPLHTTIAALPHLQSSEAARIVNIASIGGKVAVPHLLPYTASKFALVGLSEGLTVELRGKGIFVTTVCPGLMRTGSPRNAIFKGQHRKEYAWFAVGDSLPLLTVSAESAARQIVEACRRGSRRLTIGVPARIAQVADQLFPSTVSRIGELVNQLLPSPTKRPGKRRLGRDSESAWAPSLLTRLTDRAARKNNELAASRHA